MNQLIERFDFRFLGAHAVLFVSLDRFCDQAVVMRDDLLEERQIVREIAENLLPFFAACRGDVLGNQRAQLVNIALLGDFSAFDQLLVEPLVEVMMLVEDICHAARHARGKVFAGASENDDLAACHVLAAVLADALNDRCCA